ncbi:unnamed protein product [Mytilus coruscus]|uniref:Uncharacterized protein n=1 Tax=Mytilus coruscus TaxID=42192 RepID=A0A6J8DSX4_MYTCO|nr:unnamed protein product [Mytilus coruscus]
MPSSWERLVLLPISVLLTWSICCKISYPYNKVNITAEKKGGDTKNRRTGKARADAYFTRGNNIISRSEELHTITGTEIKVIRQEGSLRYIFMNICVVEIESWESYDIVVLQSNDSPDIQEVTVDDPTVNEKENAETVEMATMGSSPSPRKEPLSEIQATNIPSTSASKSKNKCAICHIVYGSEADIESLWVQCSRNGCNYKESDNDYQENHETADENENCNNETVQSDKAPTWYPFSSKTEMLLSKTTDGATYKDISDGYLNQLYSENDGPLSQPENISFTFNTDGAPVFQSSKVSVWPLFMVINELPYKLRMMKENTILAGLWFGNQKPSMSTFLSPFLDSFKID